MAWRRKEGRGAASAGGDGSPCYVRFLDGGSTDDDDETAIPKGYVPMVVGGEDGGGERVLVPVSLLKEPRMAALLEMAAQRFGYGQQGVLRIPCDARHFRRVVGGAATSGRRRKSLEIVM